MLEDTEEVMEDVSQEERSLEEDGNEGSCEREAEEDSKLLQVDLLILAGRRARKRGMEG